MLGAHKSISMPQATEYAKEMARHEAHHSQYGAPGRPYVFREFPKMLYKASVGSDTMDTIQVYSDEEQRREEAKGFAATQERALELRGREHREHGILAAERNFEIAKGRISERAAAEVRAAEAEHGASHLPVVPEKPKRHRRTKAEMEAARA